MLIVEETNHVWPLNDVHACQAAAEKQVKWLNACLIDTEWKVNLEQNDHVKYKSIDLSGYSCHVTTRQIAAVDNFNK